MYTTRGKDKRLPSRLSVWLLYHHFKFSPKNGIKRREVCKLKNTILWIYDLLCNVQELLFHSSEDIILKEWAMQSYLCSEIHIAISLSQHLLSFVHSLQVSYNTINFTSIKLTRLQNEYLHIFMLTSMFRKEKFRTCDLLFVV